MKIKKASVAIVCDCDCHDHESDMMSKSIVVGLRKDDNTLTVPGGHVEEGEDVYEAMVRELKEEANLEPSDIKMVDVTYLETKNGTPILVYLFLIHPKDISQLDNSNDPDEEVHYWSLMEVTEFIDKKDSLHVSADKNIALKYILKNSLK